MVRTGARMITSIRRKSDKRLEEEQEGTSAYTQFFMSESGTLDSLYTSKWKCKVIIDSSFFYAWEFVFTLNFFFLMYFIPLLFSTNNLELVFLMKKPFWKFFLRCFSLYNLMDVLYNSVKQHQINETEVSVYIRDSFFIYARKLFLFDLLSNGLTFWILFLDERKLFHTIFSGWVENVQDFPRFYSNFDTKEYLNFD